MKHAYRLLTIAAVPVVLMVLMALTAPAAFAAEKYPSRPVRVIVPYPPGGGSDLTGRAIGQKLSDALGQTFVIDNRPGATGLVGEDDGVAVGRGLGRNHRANQAGSAREQYVFIHGCLCKKRSSV